MSMNRIQKLIFSEYCAIDDIVLIESPFAETTRNGVGLRQVQIAITSSKFILATEIMKDAEEYPVYYYPGRIDADIECMELISIFPIEYVSLSIWQRRRRKVIKARFHTGDPKTNIRVAYFELGGLEKRWMFWNLWREKVRFLSPDNLCNSGTEASVASSTSAGSLYLAQTRVSGNKVWQYYEAGYRPGRDGVEKLTNNLLATCNKDRDRGDHLSCETSMKTVYVNRRCESGSSLTSSATATNEYGSRLNRFGEGIDERCSSSLYIPGDTYYMSPVLDSKTFRHRYRFKNYEEFCDQCVSMWTKRGTVKSRLYAVLPCPDLNHCSGILSTDRAGKMSMLMKRSKSQISIREERLHLLDSESIIRARKPVIGSQSANHVGNSVISHQVSPDDAVLFFWTTDYWYKPDKVNRMLAHYRARKPDDKNRKRLFFGRKRTKVIADCEEKPLANLRAAMKMNKTISAWDLDSTALATQLTIMDSSLFLKIPLHELRLLKKSGNARNCKNFMTWLIFSHRVTCLVASQILLATDTKSRARLISRFILVCDKCNSLSNYHSTTSILNGLQCPAIFRLYASWARVRQYHSTTYAILKKLCDDYKTPILPNLTKPPFLPSAKLFLDLLLGKLLPQVVKPADASVAMKLENLELNHTLTVPKFLQQFLSVFNIYPGETDGSSMSQDSIYQNEVSQTDMCSNCTGTETTSSIASTALPSNMCPGLPEAESLLRACQHATRKYELVVQREAEEFLLKVPYHEHHVNFQLSLMTEPSS